MLAVGCASSDSSKPEAKPAPRDSFPVDSRASFRVDAHGGIEWAVIDGSSWHTRLRDDGNHNPPKNWPQLIDGIVTRPSENRAVFVSDQIPGRLVFTPASVAVWPCL